MPLPSWSQGRWPSPLHTTDEGTASLGADETADFASGSPGADGGTTADSQPGQVAEASEPERSGCFIETAHIILTGLDLPDGMAFFLAFD